MPISFLDLLHVEVILCLVQEKSLEKLTPMYLKTSTLEREKLSSIVRVEFGSVGEFPREGHVATFLNV